MGFGGFYLCRYTKKKEKNQMPACMQALLIYRLPAELSAGGSCASRHRWDLQRVTAAAQWLSSQNISRSPRGSQRPPPAAQDAGETLAFLGGSKELEHPPLQRVPCKPQAPPQRESPSSRTRCAASRLLTSLVTQGLGSTF